MLTSKLFSFPALFWCLLCASAPVAAREPIALHPENSHYFLWRGKPTILITSGEHYGAVVNRDFDYQKYLAVLESNGFNLTRTFSGVYCEAPESFKIRNNTLAPAEGAFLCPWTRSDQPGYAGGGNKFDLSKWDEAYFARLRDFLKRAAASGVVVELVLFCPMYNDREWSVSPLHPGNNVNSIGAVSMSDVFTLNHPQLVAIQEAMVRKIVAELNEFDNLYFEICNEPYERGGQTLKWQSRIAEVIEQAEWSLSNKHLIAQNLPCEPIKQKAKRPQALPNVSILNFHGTKQPPEQVQRYYDFDIPLACDETGGVTSISPYRIAGWEFLIAGGSVYDNLDFSFSVGYEDGSGPIDAPGSGGAKLRAQLAILARFMSELNFLRMAPGNSVIAGGVPEGATARALVEDGKTYVIYLHGGNQADLALRIPSGTYIAEWIDTKTGKVAGNETIRHDGGTYMIRSPEYEEDIALRVRRD